MLIQAFWKHFSKLIRKTGKKIIFQKDQEENYPMSKFYNAKERLGTSVTNLIFVVSLFIFRLKWWYVCLEMD